MPGNITPGAGDVLRKNILKELQEIGQRLNDLRPEVFSEDLDVDLSDEDMQIQSDFEMLQGLLNSLLQRVGGRIKPPKIKPSLREKDTGVLKEKDLRRVYEGLLKDYYKNVYEQAESYSKVDKTTREMLSERVDPYALAEYLAGKGFVPKPPKFRKPKTVEEQESMMHRWGQIDVDEHLDLHLTNFAKINNLPPEMIERIRRLSRGQQQQLMRDTYPNRKILWGIDTKTGKLPEGVSSVEEIWHEIDELLTKVENPGSVQRVLSYW